MMDKKIVNAKVNFAWNALYHLTEIIVPIITVPFLSRTLKAEGLGVYSFAYSVAYYFFLFIRMGLHNYGNRSIAYVKDDKEKLSETFWNIYAFQAFLGVIFSAIYIYYSWMFAPDSKVAFMTAFIVVAGMIDVTWCLHGLQAFKIASVRDIVVKLATTFLIFIFVKTTDDAWKYALIYSCGIFFSQLITFPVVLRNIPFRGIDIGLVRKHIKPNIILFIPTIAVSLYKIMDKIMLGIMSSNVELGYYQSSEHVVRVPLALIQALGTVMLPYISNMISNNSDDKVIDNIFSKSIEFAMFLSSSICFGIMTVAEQFVPLFYGKGFDRCILLFYILLPSCIFLAFANVIRTQYLLPRKKDAFYIFSLVLGAVVNIALNFVLIRKYGAVGTAIGTLVAETSVCIVQAVAVFGEAKIYYNIKNSILYVLAGISMFIIFKDVSFQKISNMYMRLITKIIVAGLFYLFIVGVWLLVKKNPKTILVHRKGNNV